MAYRVTSDVTRVKRQSQIRVLIADDDNQLSRRLADFISDRGFETRTASNGREARAQIADWKPSFILADIMLKDGNALSLIDFIRAEKSLRQYKIHVLVMSGHNTEANVRSALNHGAKDYIVKPFRHEDVLKRLIFHSRGYRELPIMTAKDLTQADDSSLVLHLTDLVLRQALSGGTLEDILHNLTRMVSMKVDGVRCSIVNCLDQKSAVVVTSNDARSAKGIQLDLNNYPEILHVMNTQAPIAIENLDDNPELSAIRAKVRDINFNSIIVCPVSRHAKPFGVLSLRMPAEKKTLSDNEIRFVEIVSHVISLVLSAEIHKENKDFWHDTKAQDPIPLRALPKVKNS